MRQLRSKQHVSGPDSPAAAPARVERHGDRQHVLVDRRDGVTPRVENCLDEPYPVGFGAVPEVDLCDEVHPPVGTLDDGEELLCLRDPPALIPLELTHHDPSHDDCLDVAKHGGWV